MDTRERLQNLLDLRGLSHAQVALRAKVSRSLITMYLGGNRDDIGLSRAARIATALGVSLDWLAGLPERQPDALSPEEAELLRLYRAAHPDLRAMILRAVKALTGG